METGDRTDVPELAPQKTVNRSLANRLVPYLCACIALIVAYVGTMYFTNQRILAGMLAAFATLVGFIGCRLIQLRGRLTLGILVVGFPLVVAIGFTTVQRLNPFVRHQKSITMLRGSGFLTIRTRAADEYGGWKQDHSRENMLPTWIANRIGPDCMSELTRIEGNLAEFQSLRFSDIDATHLRFVELVRVDESPSISPKLVQWFNRADQGNLHLIIPDYTDADGEALQNLEQRCTVTVNVDNFTGDLSKLRGVTLLRLRGKTLSMKQVDQIAGLTKTSIDFIGLQLSAGVFRKLQQESWNEEELRQLTIQDCSLDLPALEALASLPGRMILRSVTLPKTDDLELTSTGNYQRTTIWVTNCNISFQDTRNLAAFFQCKEIIAEVAATEKEIETLWDLPHLNGIRVLQFPTPSKFYERPSK